MTDTTDKDLKRFRASADFTKITGSTKGYVEALRDCLVDLIDPDAEIGKQPFNKFSYLKGQTIPTTCEYKSFEDYLAKWSRFTYQQLKDLFHNDLEISNLLDIAVMGKTQRNDITGKFTALYNIQDGKAPTGTSKEAGLRRLRKDHKDLHDKVMRGELSVNQAMLDAGFRKPTKTIPLDSPQSAVRALLRVFDHEDLISAINDEINLKS